jgi:hypothetical protein
MGNARAEKGSICMDCWEGRCKHGPRGVLLLGISAWEFRGGMLSELK